MICVGCALDLAVSGFVLLGTAEKWYGSAVRADAWQTAGLSKITTAASCFIYHRTKQRLRILVG